MSRIYNIGLRKKFDKVENEYRGTGTDENSSHLPSRSSDTESDEEENQSSSRTVLAKDRDERITERLNRIFMDYFINSATVSMIISQAENLIKYVIIVIDCN